MASNSGLAPFGSQTLIELHVGRESRRNRPNNNNNNNNNKANTMNITVEVLIRLAREDISWWNKDVDGHWKQLCKIIGRRILPVEFPSLLSSNTKHPHHHHEPAVLSKAKHKHKTTTAPVKKGKPNKSSALARLPLPPPVLDCSTGVSSKKRVTGNVTNLFGDTIQITYQVEELRPSERATLLYQTDNEEEEEEEEETRITEKQSSKQSSSSRKNKTDQVKRIPKAATFRRCTKLPKRISIWCHPFDPNNPTQPTTSSTGGFPRPEFIPMASLFHEFEPST
eukprot:scaffold62739_cov50-Attheya_sp.AAC.2